MKAAEVLDAVKTDLRSVNDQIDAVKVQLAALQARKQALIGDRDDLQAFLDFKAANP